MLDRASEWKGLLVVSREEGALLGNLNVVQVDPRTKTVAAFSYRRPRVGGGAFFVPGSDVESLGRDTVLVSTERAVTRVTAATPAPGKSLNDLRGAWVTDLDGNHLGTLVDVEFSPNDWAITELFLAEDKHLAVNSDEIRIGDEILVPVDYAERVEDVGEAKTGFLGRAFGKEAIEDTRKILKRALRRKTKVREPVETA